MKCYNCDQPDHRSERCPLPQQNTRCSSCHMVATRPQGHKTWCQTPGFVSMPIDVSSIVFPITDIFTLQFKDVAGIYVISGNQSIQIGSQPLSIPSLDAFVTNVDSKLVFTTSRPSEKRVTIVNRRGEPVIWLKYNGVILEVNSRYEIRPNGVVSYKYDKGLTIKQTSDACKIQLNNQSDVFKARITVFKTHFVFDVYPVGAILVDPMQKIAAEDLENANGIRDTADEPNQSDARTAQQTVENNLIDERNDGNRDPPDDSNQSDARTSTQTDEVNGVVDESNDGKPDTSDEPNQGDKSVGTSDDSD